MSSGGVSVTRQVHFATGGRGRRIVRDGPAPAPTPSSPDRGTVPRVSRLMALAVRMDELLAEGTVADQAELARLAHVTKPRITQIMNLVHLAPDIQEAVLHLPPTIRGRDPITETMLRPIAAEVDWARQREMWGKLRSAPDSGEATDMLRRDSAGDRLVGRQLAAMLVRLAALGGDPADEHAILDPE